MSLLLALESPGEAAWSRVKRRGGDECGPQCLEGTNFSHCHTSAQKIVLSSPSYSFYRNMEIFFQLFEFASYLNCGYSVTFDGKWDKKDNLKRAEVDVTF